jgi:hypothetical protein
MRLIIEARLEGAQTGATAAEATIVDVVERQDHSVADLGLTLAEGRALLAGSGATRDIRCAVRYLFCRFDFMRAPSPIATFSTNHGADGHDRTRIVLCESDEPTRCQRS